MVQENPLPTTQPPPQPPTPTHAATLIQKTYKRHKTRLNYLLLRHSALTIQRYIRGFLARLHLATRKPHLIALHTTSKRLRATRDRITTWEREMKNIRNLRAQKVREWEEGRVWGSCVRVQRWWRGRLVRREEMRRREGEVGDDEGKVVPKVVPMEPRLPSSSELEKLYDGILSRLAISRKDAGRVDTVTVLGRLKEAQGLLDKLYDQRTEDVAMECASLRRECDTYLEILKSKGHVHVENQVHSLLRQFVVPPGDVANKPAPYTRVPLSQARVAHRAALEEAGKKWWQSMEFSDADDQRWNFTSEPETGSCYWL
ncbi:hypothetical protein HDV00_004153 [Rhizophlyctis rosea]|nr:hypothetical protein HDV00_004153 [Rhizophlyctis rosea]